MFSYAVQKFLGGRVPLIYFPFCYLWFLCHIQEIITKIDFKELTIYFFLGVWWFHLLHSILFLKYKFIYFNWTLITLQYCIGFAIHEHESATGIHLFPILNLPPSSLPIPSLWVVPVHQPQASSIMHRTWTGNSFLIWYYTCFNAILPNHPTPSLSHRVQKTVLYICVSFDVSHTGLLLPFF